MFFFGKKRLHIIYLFIMITIIITIIIFLTPLFKITYFYTDRSTFSENKKWKELKR